MGKGSGAAAALFVLGIAVPASADPVVLSPAAGEAVRAGQLVEVRWDGVPAETEEMELLLSLDDGASFPVRLTKELERDRRSAYWRVPNLPAGRARLLVRYESDGVETEGQKGPAFRILGDPTLALETVRRREGEVWLDASTDEAPDGGQFEDSRAPTLREAAGEEALLESYRDLIAHPAASPGFSEEANPVVPLPAAVGPCCIDLPSVIPQRK